MLRGLASGCLAWRLSFWGKIADIAGISISLAYVYAENKGVEDVLLRENMSLFDSWVKILQMFLQMSSGHSMGASDQRRECNARFGEIC